MNKVPQKTARSTESETTTAPRIPFPRLVTPEAAADESSESVEELQIIEAELRVLAEALAVNLANSPGLVSDAWRIVDSCARRMAVANEQIEVLAAGADAKRA